MTSYTKGIVIALAATTVWATTAIFISYLLKNYPLQPLTLAFWRDLMIGLALILILRVFQPQALKITRRDLPFFLAYGFIGLAAFNGMWTYSVQLNGASVATVLAYSSPAFTVLLARPILNEALTGRKLVAVAVSLAGCALVAKAYSPEAWLVNADGNSGALGIVIGLGTGLAFAFYNLGGRWSAKRFSNSWTVTAYGFTFAAGGLFLANLVLALTQNSQPFFTLGTQWDGWIILAILAVGPSLAGFGLYTMSLRHLQASTAGLIASLEPALTAIMAFFILNESMGGLQWLGAGLILAAVVMVQGDKK